MSLHPQPNTAIPDETVRIARLAFPQGSLYMRMRNELGPIYEDESFRALFSSRGQPAESPARLALVSIMQFAEGLSDRQAADAVRSRIDWKYALALELSDPGFDASVLTEFRERLIAGGAEELLFEQMLTRLRERGLLKARGRQRTDSTHVLAAIRQLNRLECVGETMRRALNALAVVAPAWLRAWVPAPWFDRYARRFEEYRLPPGRPERYALAELIGVDGIELLDQIYDQAAPAWLRQLPAVEVLRQVWLQQFYLVEGVLRWRAAEDLPPSALLISSPYDAEARYSQRRQTQWTGYKVHLTESCDEDLPHLITDVETTPATKSDYEMTAAIEAKLAARALLPREHLVDAGYVTSDHLVNSRQEYDVELLGPVAEDNSWQARAGAGFDVGRFAIDWQAQRATCPNGRTSVSWIEGLADHHDHEVIHVHFARRDCQRCPVRAACTRATKQGRVLTIRPQAQHEAIQAARQHQQTEAFKERYRARAGIEGTISQGVRIGDLRRSRYIGLAKTHLQHVLLASGINLLRAIAWLEELPRAQTRKSPFLALAA